MLKKLKFIFIDILIGFSNINYYSQRQVKKMDEWMIIESSRSAKLTPYIPEEEVPQVEIEEMVVNEDHFKDEPLLVQTDLEIRMEMAFEAAKELWSLDNRAQIKITALILIYLVTSSIVSCCTWNNQFINGVFFWAYIFWISYSFEFREKVFRVVDLGIKIWEYANNTYKCVVI